MFVAALNEPRHRGRSWLLVADDGLACSSARRRRVSWRYTRRSTSRFSVPARVAARPLGGFSQPLSVYDSVFVAALNEPRHRSRSRLAEHVTPFGASVVTDERLDTRTALARAVLPLAGMSAAHPILNLRPCIGLGKVRMCYDTFRGFDSRRGLCNLALNLRACIALGEAPVIQALRPAHAQHGLRRRVTGLRPARAPPGHERTVSLTRILRPAQAR